MAGLLFSRRASSSAALRNIVLPAASASEKDTLEGSTCFPGARGTGCCVLPERALAASTKS